MKKTFIDTSFSIELVSEKDVDHARAIELSLLYEGFSMLTTDCILLEIGNSLPRNFRQEAVETINNFILSEEIEVRRLRVIIQQSLIGGLNLLLKKLIITIRFAKIEVSQ